MSNVVSKILNQIWKTLISLKFAVMVMVSLTLSLITATLIESSVDTKTAQYYVYRSWWFFLILALFGALILAVAISRYPWKKKHIPFLMAHAGILMILGGSWVTYTNGIDGNITLAEGDVNSAVEMDQQVLVFKKGESINSVSFPWMPQSVADHFPGSTYPEYGVKVDRFIADASPKFQFAPADLAKNEKTGAAIQIKIMGAPMGGAPELWLWSGDVAWSTQKLGPARFLIRSEESALPPSEEGEARLEFVVGKKGELRFEATSPRGEKKSGKLVLDSKEPTVVNPGWKMPIQVLVKSFIPAAANKTEYIVSPVRSQNPTPAILISLMGNASSHLWLGLGDRAEFTNQTGEQISVGYFQKRVILPFALRLKEFVMKNNPGTMDPASYASNVQVLDGLQKGESEMNSLPVHTIEMNEPLKVQHYTFYQASYIPDFPRVTTTVLSVNFDPGRALKYGGSLLLVLGAILLYLAKAVVKKRTTPVL
jgi:hypothetical protein